MIPEGTAFAPELALEAANTCEKWSYSVISDCLKKSCCGQQDHLLLLPSTGLNVSLDRACCKVPGRDDAQPACVTSNSVEEEGEKGGRERSGRSHTDRAGHGNRLVMIPTCVKGVLAAIKGLLGATGLSETAPSVWPLPCPGFRPARLGNAPIPCSAAALLSTMLAPCTTQTSIRQTYLHSFGPCMQLQGTKLT